MRWPGSGGEFLRFSFFFRFFFLPSSGAGSGAKKLSIYSFERSEEAISLVFSFGARETFFSAARERENKNFTPVSLSLFSLSLPHKTIGSPPPLSPRTTSWA